MFTKIPPGYFEIIADHKGRYWQRLDNMDARFAYGYQSNLYTHPGVQTVCF